MGVKTRRILALALSLALAAVVLAPALPGADGNLVPRITDCEWRGASVFKFHPDFTWEESYQGKLIHGKWTPRDDNSFSDGRYTYTIENDGQKIRRAGTGRPLTWTRAATTSGRLTATSTINSTASGHGLGPNGGPPTPAPSPPAGYSAPDHSARILTPPPPATPRINGPRVFGARPGSIFLHTIPATGDRPMTFAADGLPGGLSLDAATGRITGRVAAAGEYNVTLRAKNALGEARRDFKIIIGDKIALTPPLGWASWHAWGVAIDQERMLAAARALVSTGLANHGWSYVNIDAGWEGVRGGKHNAIQPNCKFPDMKALIDEIHSLGLKFGIYNSPWVLTFGNGIGSYSDNADGSTDWIKSGEHTVDHRIKLADGRGHRQFWRHGKYSFVQNNARQWAEWGVDYLKYDWHHTDIWHAREMHEALRATDRDIIFHVCCRVPYADVPHLAKFANMVRPSGDTYDTWDFILANGFARTPYAAFSRPGHWVHPDDMLVIGHVGGWSFQNWAAPGGTIVDGPDGKPQRPWPTRLTADEQYTHVSLWALLASPIMIGCDLEQIDAFTLSLLSNDEVIEINQDPLGLAASPIMEKENVVIYLKHLEDGSLAAGLFNKAEEAREASFTLRDFGLRGKQTVRDLWRQRDIATLEHVIGDKNPPDTFTTTVNPHGVVLLKIYPGNTRER